MLGYICQFIIIILVFSSLYIKKNNELDLSTVNCLKGASSLLVAMSHVPISDVKIILMARLSAPFCVCLFSFLSAYGTTLQFHRDPMSFKRIPRKMLSLCCFYFFVLLLKYNFHVNIFSGGITWLNTFILFNMFFYVFFAFIIKRIEVYLHGAKYNYVKIINMGGGV